MHSVVHSEQNPTNPPPLPGSGWIRRFRWWRGADAWFARVSFTITVLLMISLAGNIFLPLDQSLAFYDRLIVVIWASSPFINWLIMGNMARKTKELAKKQLRYAVVILNMAILAPNFFLGMMRADLRKELEWKCDGKIADFYVSNNHQARAIVISGATDVTFEGVAPSFYEIVKVGDTIVKRPWDECAELNGVRHKIVFRGESWPFRLNPQTQSLETNK